MVKKIVFWHVWIITFKVRSLAQSDQTRRVITTFTPFDQVSSRYHLFFSPLFRTNFHPAQKLRYTIFRSFLSVIFFPFFLFLFFFCAWIYKLLKIGRVYTIVWATAGITYAAPTYLSVRHQILIFLHEYDNDSPSPWTCLLTKVHRTSDPRANRKRAPRFTVEREETMTRGDGWRDEAPGWIRNEPHDSCLPMERKGRLREYFVKKYRRMGKASGGTGGSIFRLRRHNDGTSSIR